MKVSVPASAPMGPPETGASTKVSCQSGGREEVVASVAVLMARMVAVSIVPHSIISFEVVGVGVGVLGEEEAWVTPARMPVVGSR